jgi:hypothetical protein
MGLLPVAIELNPYFSNLYNSEQILSQKLLNISDESSLVQCFSERTIRIQF